MLQKIILSLLILAAPVTAMVRKITLLTASAAMVTAGIKKKAHCLGDDCKHAFPFVDDFPYFGDFKAQGDSRVWGAKNKSDIEQAIKEGLNPSQPIQVIQLTYSEMLERKKTQKKGERFPTNVEGENLIGRTPLSIAMLPDRSSALAQALLHYNADPNTYNNKEYPFQTDVVRGTPLHTLATHCAAHSHEEMMMKLTLLLNAGADQTLRTRDNQKQTAEEIAREQRGVLGALNPWNTCTAFINKIKAQK